MDIMTLLNSSLMAVSDLNVVLGGVAPKGIDGNQNCGINPFFG